MARNVEAKSVLSISARCKIYTVFPKNRTPKTFYYNFAKIALISIKISTHNLHNDVIKLQYYKTVVHITLAQQYQNAPVITS